MLTPYFLAVLPAVGEGIDESMCDFLWKSDSHGDSFFMGLHGSSWVFGDDDGLLTWISFRAIGLPASRKAMTSSRSFRDSVMENRFVFVPKLQPSSIAKEMLEQSGNLDCCGFRLPVHFPNVRFLTGGIGKGLSEAEAGSDDESEGFGGDE